MNLHTIGWILGGLGAAIVLTAAAAHDLRRDAGLTGLLALLGLLLASQGWRLVRLDARLRAARRPES